MIMDKLSIDTLRGRQSVRVTFQLSAEVIELLRVMALQLGIKQKTLFEHIIEKKEILEHLAKHQAIESSPGERRQKTFVVSRDTLAILEHLTKQYQVPRNVLVEVSILRLLPILAVEKQKHKQREVLLKEMAGQVDHGQKILQMAEKLVGREDQVYKKIADAVASCCEAYSEINSMVERGRRMEDL